MRWTGRKRVNSALVLMISSNIISVQNSDTDHTDGWRVTCLAVTRSASTSKRLRCWTSLITWSQSPAGTGLWWRGSEWSGRSGQSEWGDWQAGGELSAPLCGPLSRGEGETLLRDIVTSSWSPGPGDGEGQQPPESQEGQEKVCGPVLHSQAEKIIKFVS